MKDVKENKGISKENPTSGITLIALVVTIIVLLILAGVTIATLTGENGILTQASKAKDKTAEAGAIERVQVEVAGSYGIDGKLDLSLLKSNITKNLPTAIVKGDNFPIKVTLDGYTVIVDAYGISVAGTKYEKDTTITVGGTKVVVPAKFTISGLQEESTVNNGLVIYLIPDGETVNWNDETAVENAQKTYDQFVWVPVPNAIAEDMNGDNTVDATDIDLMIAEEKYPMAIATGTTTTDGEGNTVTNYRGILYNFSAKTDTDGNVAGVTISDITYSTTGYREPSTVSDDNSSYLLQVNGILNTNYVDSTSFGSALQEEFNTMVTKVASNGGFWVGRYETSGMSNSTTTNYASSNEIKVNVIKGTTTGISDVTWYRMYAQEKSYAKLALGTTTTVTSSMIWGSQWDQIMIWMKNIKNDSQKSYYVLNSVGMGNFGSISGVDDGASSTSSPATTGYSNITRVNNIYDLAGNVYDWTLETNHTDRRVLRGGCYGNTDSSYTRAGFRIYDHPRNSYAYSGSRSSLY